MEKKWKIVLPILIFFLLIHIFSGVIQKSFYRTTARHIATIDYSTELQTKDNIDYLIIGDSIPLHAFQAQLLSRDSYSICISGASLFDMYMALKKIDLKKVKKGIIVSNSFNSHLHFSEDFWKRFVLTGTYSLSELHEFYQSSRNNHSYPSSENSYLSFMTKAALTKYRLNHYPLEVIGRYFQSHIWAFNFYEQNLQWLKERNGSLPIEVPGSDFKLSKNDFELPYREFYSKPLRADLSDIYYLKSLLSLVSQSNIPVFMPVLPLANGEFPDGLEELLKRESASYRGIEVFKLSVGLNRDDFFDFNHLNSRGSFKASAALNKWLNTH